MLQAWLRFLFPPMRTFLLAKLHRIVVTDAQVDYIGSVSIDEDFMEQSGIVENEQVHVVDLNTGSRWITYAIRAPRGSKVMSLNGGGALLGKKGDRLVVMTYTTSRFAVKPKVLYFNDRNDVIKTGTTQMHGTIHPDLEKSS